jgi:hypothetical protein
MNEPISNLRSLLKSLKIEMEQQAEEYQPYHSFWYNRPAKRFPLTSIRSVADYDGSDRLNVVCTQTELPASAQKKLVDEWCDVLPMLHNVKFLWFHSKVMPKLFDAACEMRGLEGLYLKWSSIESIENLPNLRQLKYLYIGSSPGVVSIEPLARMPQLWWLELENLKRISDFSPLTALTKLTGLAVTGSMWTKQKIETLKPISTLHSLTWLAVDKASDESLEPLANLSALEWLGLPNRYPMEEFAKLSTKLSRTDCKWFRPYVALTGIHCRKCKSATMLMLTGKGKPILCAHCDLEKLERHVAEFNRCVEAAT